MSDYAVVVNIARCTEHGLHGCRARCFECERPVEQVPMVPAVVLQVFLGRVLADRRESDKLLCHIQSARRALLGGDDFDLISDDMVERAARAIWDEVWPSGDDTHSWDILVAGNAEPGLVQSLRSDAREILTAAFADATAVTS